ncbi:MAG: hypothetical protein O2780_00895 [Proteobacteria bacterium]|nr:hypothetical protein [Pseudomonadota bacterium]MDA1300560.1 hypothetical protein [Pseudomonadota bacterium]
MSGVTSDKEYFKRIGEANQRLPNPGPPGSLAETLVLMGELEGHMDAFHRLDIDHDGDLRAHLNFLNHVRSIERR